MSTDIDWEEISHTWEALVEKNEELKKQVREKDYILGILKSRAKIIDKNGNYRLRPVPNCDVSIIIYHGDLANETIIKWLEEQE